MMIEHREGEIVLMVFAEDWIALEVGEGVVHPAHVPLEGEPESAEVWRASDLRPGGGFFGDGDHAGAFGVNEMVERFKEFDCFKVFTSAELVRNPFAFLAGVIKIKHRSDCIDAEAVDMVALAPEKRVGDEEISDFMAAEIENERAPILMRAFAWIFVFVKGGAVERGERPIIAREMCRHPIDDDADVVLVQVINEILEIIRRAEARGRRVEAGDLVSPTRIKGVLGDREEFNVSKAEPI